MNRFLLFFCGLSLMMTWSSCVSNVEEELYPPEVCDTTNVTYSLLVEPIIAQNCYACHSAIDPSSGISLEGYANLKKQVDDERLIGAIRHQSGYSPMPKDAPALSECNILKIEKWVAEGAQDN
jgi:hypothetical protein